MTDLDREPRAKGVEQTPNAINKNVLILGILLRSFLVSAKSEGLNLFEIEFNRKETTTFPNGTTQETTTPVTTRPVEGISKKHWKPGKYLLSGTRAAYYIEIDNFPTRDGSEAFLGITKTSPFDEVENKAEWAKTLIEGKIKPVLFKRLDNEVSLFPSLSVTFGYGSTMSVRREGGEDKLLEDFFQQLTEDFAI